MSIPHVQWLFLDLNSYFASVEQELRPELRGRPIAIVPVEAETTCCIAVSYEARAFGLRTGVSVQKARELCPGIELVEGRPKTYVEMHHRILAAVGQVLPVDAVLSCDEFVCRLAGTQQQAPRALELAAQIKNSIRKHAGGTLRCSIGLGPNRALAKIAAEMQKPDGLMLIARNDLPHVLYRLELADISGIGKRMEKRLRAAGIHSVRELMDLSRERFAALWGSVLGDRLWLELRGEDLPAPEARPRQTISRQHILPPPLRSPEGCRAVALKMLEDCVRRMRRHGLEAGGLGLAIYYLHHDHVFEAHCNIPPCGEGITMQEQFLPLLAGAPNGVMQSVCVFLSQLQSPGQTQLFPPSPQAQTRAAAAEVMETMRGRFGKHAVYLGSVHAARDAAPARISFGPPPSLDEF